MGWGVCMWSVFRHLEQSSWTKGSAPRFISWCERGVGLRATRRLGALGGTAHQAAPVARTLLWAWGGAKLRLRTAAERADLRPEGHLECTVMLQTRSGDREGACPLPGSTVFTLACRCAASRAEPLGGWLSTSVPLKACRSRRVCYPFLRDNDSEGKAMSTLHGL